MRYMVVLLMIFYMPFCWPKPDFTNKGCPQKATATVISLQGNASFDPEGNGSWHDAQLNEKLCEGGRVWVKPNSRASLSLPGNDVLRLNENTVITLKAISPNKASLLDIVKGFIHFIARKPKEVKIESGIANAAPLGTEFAFSVDESKAGLWVYEGSVKFYNQHGSLNLKPGQTAEAYLGKAPQLRIDIKPQDAVNWALYYPPLLPYSGDLKESNPDISAAIKDFRKGRIDLALQRLDAVTPAQQTPHFYKVRGAMRLIVGQVELAMQDIRALLTNNRNDADALALQSVIALTQNRKDEAFDLVNKAITFNSQSSTAYTALSYAEQGRFNLDKALIAAATAVKHTPHDAMAVARKAELELSQGLISDSGQTAQQALTLDANLERTQTVMGFAHLLGMDTNEAMQAFNKAVELDSASPLARLGLGLAKIRDGNLEEGRRDIEIAAILDPNNSLIRSYLGKAYYEEKRGALAEDQFIMAKERDTKDPTPWFYDAILKQTTNRPIQALHNMQKAIELNDNRAVYRSKQLLDDDLAARSSSVARIYNDLGFGQRALLEGWRAVSNNRTDYSGHRLLADSYSALPSHELARTSELLQSQLLQPNNITPIQPHLGERNLAILPGSGPAGGGFNEFNPLFSKNGFSLQTSGVIGSLDTYGDEVVHSGIWDKFSYSLGQFHHQTNGFRPNNKIDQNIYNAFIQGSPSDGLNIQAEYRHRDVTHGDLFYYGDLSQFSPTLTRHVNADTYRIGMTITPTTSSNILTSVTFLDHFDNVLNIVEGFDQYQTTQRGVVGETQYNFQSDRYSVSVGGSGYEVANGTEINIPGLPIPKQRFNTHYGNFYLYNYIKFPKDITWTLGLSVDSVNGSINGNYDRTQINPKFGILWQLNKDTTLRFASFRTLSRGLWVDATIEPTNLAGFNQYFDSWPVTDAWRYGVGIDHKFSKSLLVGAEASKRDLVQPLTVVPDLSIYTNKLEEQLLRGYLYWSINNYLAASLEYQYDAFSQSGVSNYKNHIVPFSLRFFDQDYGFNASATLTYVNQNALDPTTGYEVDSGFGLLDFAIGYRIPNRYGIIKMQLKNALDKKFNFVGQSVEGQRNARLEETPLFLPDRTIFVNFTLSF